MFDIKSISAMTCSVGMDNCDSCGRLIKNGEWRADYTFGLTSCSDKECQKGVYEKLVEWSKGGDA